MLNAGVSSYSRRVRRASVGSAPPPPEPPPPPPPSGDSYPGFTTFDRSLIPHHVASGPYGAQRAISAAARATGGTTVSVGTATALENAVKAGNRSITMTANIDGASIQNNEFNDDGPIVNVIINTNGFLLSRPIFGNLSVANSTYRIMFTDTSAGRTGQVHQPVLSGRYESIVFDRINITGNGLTAGDSANAIGLNGCGAAFVNHLELINSRMHSGAAGILFGEGNNLAVLGCSIQTAALDMPPGDEAWFVRFKLYNQENFVAAYNDIRGRRFSAIRLHPEGTIDAYGSIFRNHFGYVGEAKALWVFAAASDRCGGLGTASGTMAGVFVMENVFDMNGTSPQMDMTDSRYGRLTDNQFFSSNYNAGTAQNVDLATGNTFSGVRTMPTWAETQALGFGCGDPTTLVWDGYES